MPNVLITFGRDGPLGAADFCGAEQPRHPGIVHHVEEMIGSRPAVVPLQVEPTRRGVGVPCEHPRPAGASFPAAYATCTDGAAGAVGKVCRVSVVSIIVPPLTGKN